MILESNAYNVVINILRKLVMLLNYLARLLTTTKFRTFKWIKAEDGKDFITQKFQE